MNFNRRSINRLAHSIRIFAASSSGGMAKFMAFALLVLMLAITGMNVVNSYVGRYFMSAIERQDMDGFRIYALAYICVFTGSSVVATLFRFTEERLALLWRSWLTHRMLDLYMDRDRFLRLSHSQTITNPDQRIAEDIRTLTATTLSFVLMLLNSALTAVSFSGVLWSISPALFLVAVAYAVTGSFFTILLGRPLLRLNYRQSDYEADFRAQLINVREKAEEIAGNAKQTEHRDKLSARLDRLISNLQRIIGVNRRLNLFSAGYGYMIQIIPTLLIAPLFIHGKVEFGVIAQSAMAFATLVGAFSLIVTQFQSISSFASVITRLGELVEAAEGSDPVSS